MLEKMNPKRKKTSKMKMTSNMKTNEDELKNEDILKNCPLTPQQFWPSSNKVITWIFLKTSHLDSDTTNDAKPEMLLGVQIGNILPHDEYDICSIAHERTYRKDNIFMQRRPVQSFTYILELGWGTCTLTKHTRGWTYSALQYFSIMLSPLI